MCMDPLGCKMSVQTICLLFHCVLCQRSVCSIYNKHLSVNKTLLICNHSRYVTDSDPLWGVSVSSLFSQRAARLYPSPAATSRTDSCGEFRDTEHPVVERGLEAGSSSKKESFLLLPLGPAAPLVFRDNRLLLLLRPPPWTFSPPYH